MKVLFFSPHAFITRHSIPEAIVAESLKTRDHDVLMVNCDGALSRYCLCMSAMGLPTQATTVEKEKICSACRQRRDIILQEFRFNSILLDRYCRPDDEPTIMNTMSHVNRENYTELSAMNIPVGRYALYELLLNNKLNSYQLSMSAWEEYLIYLSCTLKAVYAGRRVLEEHLPDRVATYNSFYSVNHVVCALAEQRGIPHYTLHGGSHHKQRYSVMTIFKGYLSQGLVAKSDAWKKSSETPISVREVDLVAGHIAELLKATDYWVYSIASNKTSSENLRKYFGIGPGKRVLLATMASADERFAGATIDVMPAYIEPMYPTQVDWITALIAFATGRKDLFLIIRVHPREFPNKRESVLSRQAEKLKKLFVDLPENVRVNWPDDKVSLHDLVKITDVGLNATSSAGIEMSMFGVPVVVYDTNQLFAYPAEMNYSAATPAEYFQIIDKAIADGWSFENVRKTFRWLSFKFERVSIDISDAILKPETPTLFDELLCRLYKLLGMGDTLEKRLIVRRLKKRSIPVRNSERLSVAIERNLNSHMDLEGGTHGVQPTEAEETRAICAQLGNIFRTIMKERGLTDEFELKVNQVMSRCRQR